MLKKRKKRTGYKAEGIVVGGQAAPVAATPRPAPIKTVPPIAKPSSHIPSVLKKKSILIGLAVVAIVSVIVFTVLLLRKEDTKTPTIEPDFSVPKDTPGNEVPNLTQAEIDQARNTEVTQGMIVSITSTNLVVKNSEGIELKLTLTKTTAYKKGVDYVDGVKTELVASKSVQVVYGKSKNEAVTVWYDFQ